MKKPIFPAILGYVLTILYISDFLALVLINKSFIVNCILGVVFIIGTVKFYLGSKGIKSIEFNASPFKLKIIYSKK